MIMSLKQWKIKLSSYQLILGMVMYDNEFETMENKIIFLSVNLGYGNV